MEEQLEEMRNEVYGKDDKKKVIIGIAIIIIFVVLIITFFSIKGKMDLDENSKNLDKYAREYYNENMKSANPGAAYVVNLNMLESTGKYQLKYFKKCDKRDTYVDIFVDDKGNITETKTHVKC